MTPQEQEAFARADKAIKNIERSYDAGFKAGRLQGLKEMDEAHVESEKAYQAFRMNGRCEPWASDGVKAQDVVIKLRQEYQQPN